MPTFFRAQNKGVSFGKMKKYRSEHDGTRLQGVACTLSATGLEGGSRFGGAPLDSQMEIVIFEGRQLARIYDGYIAEPVREIARFEVSRWFEMLADGSASEYENWE